MAIILGGLSAVGEETKCLWSAISWSATPGQPSPEKYLLQCWSTQDGGVGEQSRKLEAFQLCCHKSHWRLRRMANIRWRPFERAVWSLGGWHWHWSVLSCRLSFRHVLLLTTTGAPSKTQKWQCILFLASFLQQLLLGTNNAPKAYLLWVWKLRMEDIFRRLYNSIYLIYFLKFRKITKLLWIPIWCIEYGINQNISFFLVPILVVSSILLHYSLHCSRLEQCKE